MMPGPNLVDLSPAFVTVKGVAGDDISALPFTVVATNTTGWTLTALIYLADATNSGPAGASIGSGTVVNTPGSPDSSITISVAGSLTSGYSNQSLWMQLRKTNTNQARTLCNLLMVMQ